jgi:hypothetical protein
MPKATGGKKGSALYSKCGFCDPRMAIRVLAGMI